MSVTAITKENFTAEVENSSVPVILDFWAEWCGPCRMLSPIIDEIAEENNEIKVGKINVDEQRELAERFQIAAIPTVIVMKNGKVSETSVGVKPKEEILKML